MAKLTFFQLLKAGEQQLTAAGQDASAAQYLLLEGQQWTFTTLVQHYREDVPTELTTSYQDQITRICAGEPAQYILGRAPFYGREFRVTPATLIPRQETEELVEWVLSVAKPGLDLLDVGTGSGAIAISLKAERPDWTVTATDISAAAVTVAQQNAQQLQASITFAVGDLLKPVRGQRFDIVVSNPPYIDRAELPVMDDSVKRFEPDSALFADDHGLAFYRRFAAELIAVLRPGGQFFAEIGYHQGAAVREIFALALPTATVTVKTDINGHDRMVRVQLKS
ncbi:peptide chain release factor N(5)-glutamine methyltransferase [Levilactobacillus fujinensis]|uniref:Release factor glutamine methyltransferase n=1 Tax=Levilactobacillus fujinensis TaxID=2486024 RepID=A0ABW1TFI0_9LACO|nr:peptide chain release factor N(5)-glutamine methyltransferase [Levilactobacillus fujinensis]